MLQHLSREATAELNEIDIARGLPRSLSCMVSDGQGNWFVDPVLSRIKHSGKDKTDLLRERWQAFCAEPRDPDVELGRIGHTPSPVEPNPMRIAGDRMDRIENALEKLTAAMTTAAKGEKK
jgi:hypothetical protein